MTYNELKAMSLAALIYRLRDQINGMPLEGAFMSRTGEDLPAPFLAYIGDFEIRARFSDHRREELDQHFTSPVDQRDVARAHIDAARQDITDGFIPEAIAELETVKVCLFTFLEHYPGAGPYPERIATHTTSHKGDSIDGRYNDLLNAVGRVHPGETRHQTALRYIRETEQEAAMEALPAKDAQPLPGPHTPSQPC